MGTQPLHTLTTVVLDVEIRVHSDSPSLLSDLEKRFGSSNGSGAASGPFELHAIKGGDEFLVRFEGRQEKLRVAERWPRFDELIQLIVRRERKDLAFIHGACVATKQGAAILFGSSTAGKTTLGLAIRQRGFQLLADDTTPLALKTRMALPFCTGYHLRPHTRQLAAEQEWDCRLEVAPTAPSPSGAQVRWVVHVVPRTVTRTGTLGSGDLAEWERQQRLVYANVPGGQTPDNRHMRVHSEADFTRPPELRPVRQSQMVRELLRHSYMPVGMDLTVGLSAMARLLNNVNYVQLTPGSLDETVTLLEAWMFSNGNK